MGGAPTPKWDPIGFDQQPYETPAQLLRGVGVFSRQHRRAGEGLRDRVPTPETHHWVGGGGGVRF